ncbi:MULTISPECIES: DUF1156 domain-containing protein [Spirulina sp. CCY15215]|uniref:DUF1156 domain-containing protein n=1 Tax=Spirulina sp. CCY15215 TaxID=2767591 RepID=UPI001951ED38|nr:DUF1156 domain-containing protein [Spirulina major]
MPIKLLNQQVYYENGGNPFKGLHRWFSRKPLSFSRASVLASLLPGSISLEEFEYLLGIYSEGELEFLQKSGLSKEEKEKKIKSAVKLYKTPPGSKRIQKVHDYCEETWGTRTPVVLDAFAGGGSIPFEAARYGLRVYGSDLNPVAVVTMKAAMEYPLRFGPDLQVDIDKWVKWVGDEAKQRLAEFFPSNPSQGGEPEKVQNYLWAHTVQCLSCNSTVPLSPNWWLDRSPGAGKKGQWCAVKPIPNLEEKRVDFELIRGKKGKGTTILYHPDEQFLNPSEQVLGADDDKNVVRSSPSLGGSISEQDARTTAKNDLLEFDPNDYSTISRGVGKCPNCGNVIEDDVIKSQGQAEGLGHQLYAVAYKKGKGSLEFRIPTELDWEGFLNANDFIADSKNRNRWEASSFLPIQEIPSNTHRGPDMYLYGIYHWHQVFNPRQLLTLVTYVEIINEAKAKIQEECETEKAEKIASVQDDFEKVAELEDYYRAKVESISIYLGLVMDRCVDKNSRLTIWDTSAIKVNRASTTHSLNLMWNYPESSGDWRLWLWCAATVSDDYTKLCGYLGIEINLSNIQDIETHAEKTIQIDAASADSLYHISDNSVDAIITDPPYYDAVRYGELSDFFYVWMKANLQDIFPNIFINELTDKDREAISNPGRFRNMGASPEDLANQDYEAKMVLAFGEYYRVLRDDGVMTVQFNHKESGAWDTLAKSLIDAGFEITASWAVSTENPQNLHQAKKNSVSSTVLLVCRKRDPNAQQAWWDDLRPEVANLVESRAPEFEANDITGIDLYLSAFGPALNVFSKQYPILDSSGQEVRPEEAFAEARKAIANYRFRNLVQTETAGFDPLTQWYLLAWDAFKAREFPFDEARQLALAIGGFNVSDLAKTHKLLNSASGTCKLLTPQQRLKKRAFSLNDQEFTCHHLVDGLHAILALYQEEENLQLVRRFLKNTGLVSNDLFMKTLEVAFKVIPETVSEHQVLLNLWLGMDEIKAKVVVEQLEIPFQEEAQLNLFDS